MDSFGVSQFDMSELKQVIATVLQLPDKSVIYGYQQAPVGNVPFVTLGILTSTQLGSGYKFDGDKEQEYITDSKETVISVNAYGKNAFALIQKLVAVLKTSYAKQALKAASMTIPRTSPIRDLSQALGGGYEPRAQVDLTVSHIYKLKTEVKRADSVQITANNEVTVTVKVER